MKQIMKYLAFFSLAAVMLVASGCGLPQVTPAVNTIVPATLDAGPATQLPADTLPAPATPADTTQPTPSPTEAAPTEPSAYTGFVVFQQEAQEFQMYDLGGALISRIPAPGFQALSHDQVDVVGSNIYYFSRMDMQLYRANDGGLQALTNQPAKEPFGFKISPDETMIAWSVANWSSTPITSELWVGNLDGSNAVQVATYNVDQSPAFVFIPIEWTADGRVLFNRSPTGFGGYILYGGYNSLYSYNPATQEFVTYVPAEEMHGLCLDHFRLDLQKAALNCNDQGSQIVIRDLNSQQETQVPFPADYSIGGSVRFSPSGQWMAYAVAKGNPDAEAGKLLVQPADLSAAPVEIASVDGGYFVVQTWLDENTLLVTRNEGATGSTVFKINRDGSSSQDLAEGWFALITP